MGNEELDFETALMISNLADCLLDTLQETFKDRTKYTTYNMIMNTLTSSLVKVMINCPDENREKYIEIIDRNLKLNLVQIRKSYR